MNKRQKKDVIKKYMRDIAYYGNYGKGSPIYISNSFLCDFHESILELKEEGYYVSVCGLVVKDDYNSYMIKTTHGGFKNILVHEKQWEKAIRTLKENGISVKL